MRKVFLIVLLINSAFAAMCQNLVVEGAAPNLYIAHIVAPRENFYSVGRLYNQAPKLIASFNNIVMEKGLTIGQHIKIPLNSQNLDASGNTEAGETLIPLTHIVDKNETLFRIGNNFSANAELIKKWNSLSSDNLIPGKPLIVGHLKITNNQTVAGTAKPAVDAVVNSEPVAPGRKEPSVKESAVKEPPAKETIVVKETITEVKKEEPIATVNAIGSQKNDAATMTVNEPAAKKATIENTPIMEEPFGTVNNTATAGKKESVADGTSMASGQKTVSAAEVKETTLKQPSQQTSNSAGNSKINTATIDLGDINEGAFANSFPADGPAKSVNSKSGEAATFKSTSGWQDKKYYVLMNDVAPGTILKVTSAENKFVYAKVLGSMPDMKENNGVLLRISNAAASHLGIIDPKFPVQISYYQ